MDWRKPVNYFVARGGQQFGPYTEEIVRSYLAAGSLLVTDQIRAESSPAWTTIGQLFQIPMAAPPMMQPYAVPQQGGIVPPNLHWFIVLILSITFIFIYIWALVQASYARKIDQSSNAMWAFLLWIGLSVGSLVMNYQTILGNATQSASTLTPLLSLGGLVCYLVAVFSIRQSMVTYYNTVEPIQLQLSGVMTFFFGMLYLQYHMSRIARWKRTGVLSA
jgi:hypothetical protein